MKNRLIWAICIATILFCVAIGIDLSPFMRGPSYYPPEWRWEYMFENTLSRSYAPLLTLVVLFLLYFWAEKKKTVSGKKLIFFLLAGIVLFFLFQFAVLFFSRHGIGVLVHRITNPMINGYFTAALTITTVPELLRNYNSLMLDFVYHAKAHPPGAILLFYYIGQLMQLVPAFGDWAAQQVPARDDIQAVWRQLADYEKATVLASSLIIPLLSALSIIPLFFTAKLLFGFKAAVRSVFLFMVIPSLMFFIPINDTFLHLFSISAFCFFVYGLRFNNPWLLASAGCVMFLGAFFNLSLLPVLVLFFVYFLLQEYPFFKKHFWSLVRKGVFFLLGLVAPFVLLFVFFQFNFITMTLTIMKHVPDIHTRSYTIWIFYNLYDFFIFAGIPVMLVYFMTLKQAAVALVKKRFKKLDPLVVAFTLMILILNFSGSNRAETGRIWIPFLPFLVLIVSGFVTNKLKLSRKAFAIIIGLQALQLLVMQEFWVMLW